jgi:hypothetical protein
MDYKQKLTLTAAVVSFSLSSLAANGLPATNHPTSGKAQTALREKSNSSVVEDGTYLNAGDMKRT